MHRGSSRSHSILRADDQEDRRVIGRQVVPNQIEPATTGHNRYVSSPPFSRRVVTTSSVTSGGNVWRTIRSAP